MDTTTELRLGSSVKEAARTVLSTRPVKYALRSVTTSERLPLDRRRRLYLRVGKKVRWDPDAVFTHPVGTTDVRFHVEGTVREMYWVGAFEVAALPLFVEYARSSGCVLDVGAAEGVYSLLAATVMPPGSMVVAAEPGSAQLGRLRSNIAVNPLLSPRIHVLPLALSDHDGEAEFHELPGGTSSLNPEFRSGTSSRVVAVAKGDVVVPSIIGDRRIDLMKVDTESTEPEVLEGCSSLLAEHRPVVFCEVLRGRTEERLQSIVDRLEYRTWWLSDDGPVSMPRIEGQRGAVNWLFLPDDSVPLTVAA